TRASDHGEHSQKARKKRRAQYEISLEQRVHAEEDHGDCAGILVHSQKEKRQRLQLFWVEDGQVMRVAENEQRGVEEEAAERLDRAADDAEDRREERDALVHRLEQIIEERRHRDLTRHLDQKE